MRMLRVVMIGLLLIGCSGEDSNYVVVKGVGTVEVPIEYLTVNIFTEHSGESYEKANQDNKKLVVQMFDVFSDFGIADSDFVTDRSEMQPDWRYDSGSSRTEQKKVVYTGTITLRNPSHYDKLFMRLSSLENIRVSVSGYGSNNFPEFNRKAYEIALENSSKQADLLLSGSARKKGKILRILQEGIDSYNQYDDFENQIVDASNIRRDREDAPIMAMDIMSESTVPETWRKPTFSVTRGVVVIFEIVD